MSSVSVYMNYRTIKVGWCIKKNDLNSLRDTIKINCICWGGVLNPFIVVDDPESADELIEIFKPDFLMPVSNDAEIIQFLEKYAHLKPNFGFESIVGDQILNVLDIGHPLRKIKVDDGAPDAYSKVHMLQWNSSDPLADILLAMIGQYPTAGVTKLFYAEQIVKEGFGEKFPEFSRSNPIPSGAVDSLTPICLTRIGLKTNVVGRGHGVYVGDATSFDDLLEYWNLRALNRSVVFFDTNYADRFSEILKAEIESALKTNIGPYGNQVTVYSKTRELFEQAKSSFGSVSCSVILTPGFWTSANVDLGEIYIQSANSLGNYFTKNGRPCVSFELKEKPFDQDGEFYHQKFALSVKPFQVLEKGSDHTFDSIFCAEMNEFYAREIFGGDFFPVRSELYSLAVITDATRRHLECRAIHKRRLIEKFFDVFGFKVEESRAGTIAQQISRQVGGPQGARVFKIEGVRNLLSEYKMDQWFNKQAAIEKIDNRDENGRPRFEPYKKLAIEFNDSRKDRTSKDALRFLVRKNIFRPGVAFNCENCQLPFWISVDNLSSKVTCSYCDSQKSVAVDLLESHWTFRKSGLFGHDNNQEGAVPVLVSIQQLDTCLSSSSPIVIFASTIKGNGIDCESDFIAVTRGFRGKPQVVISECKNLKQIEEQDFKNLAFVSDTIPDDRFETFILLSKFGEFSPEEIAHAKAYQGEFRERFILWSKRELEPYHVYEGTKDHFVFERYDMTLTGLSRATDRVYLNPVTNPNNTLQNPEG